METNFKCKDLISFQITRRNNQVSRRFLEILEEFKNDGLINEQYFNKYRKTILDECGAANREMISFIEKFDIDLKK